MKRPLILLPLLAVVAAAVVVVAIASGSSGGASSSTSSKSTNYGSSPAATATAAKPAKPAAPPASGATRIATADHGLGPMLVDAQGRTLYLWQADTGMSSTCSGECAQDWPPETTSGAPHAAGSAKAALLGTTKRSDGTTQVTYAGHPLYRFAGDTAAGETSGQDNDGFGAPWFVVAPGGTAITRTA
jgi:predicted lipoprotein with Yx(FWY)xxD motif